MFASQLSRWVLATAACLAFVLPVSAQEEPVNLRKARQLIEPEFATVLFFAHPTAAFKDADYEGHRAKGSDLIVTYKFNFTSIVGNKCSTTLAFTFDEEGAYKDCKVTGRKGVTPPFIAADAVIDLIKDAARADPNLKDNKIVQELVDEADAKEILRKYLKFKQGTNDPEDLKRLMQLFLSIKKN